MKWSCVYEKNDDSPLDFVVSMGSKTSKMAKVPGLIYETKLTGTPEQLDDKCR